jgi:hypothetical protein
MKTNGRKKSLTFGEFITRVYDVWGQRKAGGIVQLAIKAHLFEFRGQQRLMIPSRLQPKSKDMNPLPKIRSDKAETSDPSHGNTGAANIEYQNSLNQGSLTPLWMKARARMIGFRRDDLERMHWKKVWRSMFEY